MNNKFKTGSSRKKTLLNFALILSYQSVYNKWNREYFYSQ
jgi:hypothetical protein